jgi:hypothetical protein
MKIYVSEVFSPEQGLRPQLAPFSYSNLKTRPFGLARQGPPGTGGNGYRVELAELVTLDAYRGVTERPESSVIQ